MLGTLSSAVNHFGYWLLLRHENEESAKTFEESNPGILEYARERVANGPGLKQMLLEITVWPKIWINAIKYNYRPNKGS